MRQDEISQKGGIAKIGNFDIYSEEPVSNVLRYGLIDFLLLLMGDSCDFILN